MDNFNPKLIIGLGNPGKSYKNTWHNAGFLFLEYLKDALNNTNATTKNKKEIEITKFENGTTLLKPLEYMNNSGETVQSYLKFNKYKPEETLIAFDDLDLEFGNWKLQYNKHPHSHNGVNSIHNSTGSTNYWYLRIGIETRDQKRKLQQSGEDYVLSKLSNEHQEKLKTVFKAITEEINLAKIAT